MVSRRAVSERFADIQNPDVYSMISFWVWGGSARVGAYFWTWVKSVPALGVFWSGEDSQVYGFVQFFRVQQLAVSLSQWNM